MRLSSAFFANRVDVVDQMLDVEGGFWKTTTVSANAAGFQCSAVVLVDVSTDDIGQEFSLHIDAEGPGGQRRAPVFTKDFTLDAPSMFLCLTSLVLPIEPGGGRHIYSFYLGGHHDRVDVPLAVRVARS